MSQRVEEQPERNDEEAGGGPLQRLLEASSGAISLLRGKRSESSLSAASGGRSSMGRNCLSKTQSCFRGNLLTICTVIGVCAGIVLGFSLRFSKSEPWAERDKMYVEFIGMLFLRMLKALILPLIVSSLISAIGSLDMSLSGKIGARAMIYYMSTTVCAVILGIILVVTIHPGRSDVTKATEKDTNRNVTTADTLMDLARNMLPPNLVQAAIYQYRTVLKPPPPSNKDENENDTDIYDSTSFSPMALSASPDNESSSAAPTEKPPERNPLLEWRIDHEYYEGMNILGLVVFSTVLGITLGKMQQRGQPLLKFFTCMSEAMMIITNWVVWLSPIGVLFLIAGKLLEKEDFSQIIGQLGLYFVTVLAGLFIHGLIVLPIMYTVITKNMPFRFIANMAQTLVTAFGTASSSATLPITIACLEDKNGVDPRVARFVLPIGATINMDGTALYEAVAAIFIAQVREIPLSLGSIIAISITATAASIGAAGIPQAGLVTMVMVLDTVGLPSEDVSLILAVDWLLDRFRTTINVLGDSLGAGIVDHLSKKELELLPMNPDIHVASSDHLNGKVTANNPGGSNPGVPSGAVDPSYAKGPDDMGAEWQTTTM